MINNFNKIAAEVDKLPQNVVQLLSKYNLKLATAESCTGGMISAAITSVSGSSEVFEVGLCTYANWAKSKFLGVPEETLKKYDAVSSETASSMVKGLLEISNADIAVCTTGIAGPTGGTKEKPVGTVYVGIGNNDTVEITLLKIASRKSRDEIREEATNKALSLLKDFIEKNVSVFNAKS